MEISDYAIIISSVIIVVGWFVNSLLNRRNEIHKKRMSYRLTTLHSFLPVFFSMSSSSQPFITDTSLGEKIKEARIQFQLYGHQDELKAFNEFVKAVEKQDTDEATKTINILIGIVIGRIRAELKLPAIDLQS